jgi:ethanolamine transporter EutH
MTRRLRRWSLLGELAMLAASLGSGGSVADGVRALGLVVVAMLGGLVVFVAAVLAAGLLAQRQPPYPM